MSLKIFLKPGKEKSLNRFHLWVFSGAIQHKEGSPEDGDIVEVLTSDKKFIARGHYQNGSIMVRILTFKDEPIDINFWVKRLTEALYVRKAIGLIDNKNTNVYRVFHGEGDHCPGLVIDNYNNTLVVQTHSIGMVKQVDEIAEALKKVWGKSLVGIFTKGDQTLKQKENSGELKKTLFGEVGETEVLENGHKFKVDILEGQKTGFFIDQRDNRHLLEKYSNGKTVMNLFGYTGGFSVYALGGGAAKVHTIDVSAKAVEQANANIALNNYKGKHEGITADAFEFFKNLPINYDIMVLDPPAFAKHQGALANAREAYRRLNRLAFDTIKPGGLIFTFSCSQVITKDIFRTAVFSAAAQSGRTVRILHQLTQPADHPVNLFHPETEYLKGLVLYVE
ncbi:MAG: class I SAM-dependent rRNA methyltransferase [Bacteroidia bacterium]